MGGGLNHQVPAYHHYQYNTVSMLLRWYIPMLILLCYIHCHVYLVKFLVYKFTINHTLYSPTLNTHMVTHRWAHNRMVIKPIFTNIQKRPSPFSHMRCYVNKDITSCDLKNLETSTALRIVLRQDRIFACIIYIKTCVLVMIQDASTYQYLNRVIILINKLP